MEIKDIFSIFVDKDNYIYLSLKIDNVFEMVDDIFDFFFSEETLYSHFKNQVDAPFSSEPKNYSLVFRYLKEFIDSEIEEENYSPKDYSKEIVDMIEEENLFFSKHNIRRDKVGKLGEYLMSIILEKYFSFRCVLPKMNLITNRNMSVYGIDTLYYSKEENAILFGESKFTTTLDNGLFLLSKSLEKYDLMITNDIELIFTQDKLSILNLPNEKYRNAIECFVDVPTFIKDVGIKEIWIPTFIAHGQDLDETTIISKLNTLKRDNKMGMNTKYFVMSMPIKDVKVFIELLTLKIKEKENELRNKVRS